MRGIGLYGEEHRGGLLAKGPLVMRPRDSDELNVLQLLVTTKQVIDNTNKEVVDERFVSVLERLLEMGLVRREDVRNDRRLPIMAGDRFIPYGDHVGPEGQNLLQILLEDDTSLSK